jgi:hypothetical protein
LITKTKEILMADQKKRARPSRKATRELKATKIAKALPKTNLVVGAQESDETAQAQNTASSARIEPSEPDPVAILKQQIKALKKQLAEKTAAYHLIVGQQPKSDTKTVANVLELLAKPDGATKADLVTGTGAKKGYVDALLSRILPSKGYVITSFSVDGARTKSYRISPDENSETRTTSSENSV